MTSRRNWTAWSRKAGEADAIELFLVKAVQATPEAVAGMRGQPFWPAMEAAAQTLAYEALVMGPDNALPAGLLARITQPTLVLNGGDSPAWMGSAGKPSPEPYPEPFTGCWRTKRTTWRPRPSSRVAGILHHGLTQPPGLRCVL